MQFPSCRARIVMTPTRVLKVLAHMQQKVRDALSTLNDIEQGTFPHKDSQAAISALGKYFEDQRSDLQKVAKAIDVYKIQTPDKTLPTHVLKLANQTCRRNAEALERLLPVIGFLLRSTNVRTAFEIYGPLRRLAQRVVGHDVH